MMVDCRPCRLHDSTSNAVPASPRAGRTIPHSDLADRRIEKATAQQGESHRQLGPIAIQNIVAEMGVLGCERHGLEPPPGMTENDQPSARHCLPRRLDEVVDGKRQHDMELPPNRKQRLGQENVSTTGQRPVAEARRVPRDLLPNLSDDELLLRPGETAQARQSRQSGDRRNAQPAGLRSGRGCRVGPGRLADEP